MTKEIATALVHESALTSASPSGMIATEPLIGDFETLSRILSYELAREAAKRGEMEDAP